MQTKAQQPFFAPAKQVSSASDLAWAQPPCHPPSCLQRLKLCDRTAAYAPAFVCQTQQGSAVAAAHLHRTSCEHSTVSCRPDATSCKMCRSGTSYVCARSCSKGSGEHSERARHGGKQHATTVNRPSPSETPPQPAHTHVHTRTPHHTCPRELINVEHAAMGSRRPQRCHRKATVIADIAC